MTIRHVMRRELRARTRSKAYRIGTGFLLVVAVAAPVALAAFEDDGGGGPRSVTLATVDVDDGVIDALAASSAAAGEGAVDVEPEPFASRDAAVDALRDGEVEAVLAGRELVWEDVPDQAVADAVASARQQVAVADWIAANDLDAAAVDDLQAATTLEETVLNAPDEGEGVRVGIAFLAALATFVVIVTYGPLVATSVVEEKATRVVEVLLSRITARELLAGKLLGAGTAVVVQVVIVVAGLAAALAATGSVTVPSAAWGALPILLACMVLGFALYAVLYAAAGALVSRQEDVQQTTMPLMVPVFLAYFYVASTLNLDDGTWVERVLAFVPFTSPVVLPGSYARGVLSVPEAVASLVVLAVSTVLLVRVAAGVYERSLLRTGSKVPLREVLRRPSTGGADAREAAPLG